MAHFTNNIKPWCSFHITYHYMQFRTLVHQILACQCCMKAAGDYFMWTHKIGLMEQSIIKSDILLWSKANINCNTLCVHSQRVSKRRIIYLRAAKGLLPASSCWNIIKVYTDKRYWAFLSDCCQPLADPDWEGIWKHADEVGISSSRLERSNMSA